MVSATRRRSHHDRKPEGDLHHSCQRGGGRPTLGRTRSFYSSRSRRCSRHSTENHWRIVVLAQSSQHCTDCRLGLDHCSCSRYIGSTWLSHVQRAPSPTPLTTGLRNP